MRLLHSHEILYPTLGASTSLGGAVSSFFAAANPFLQFVSLAISIVAGVLTLIHLWRKNVSTK